MELSVKVDDRSLKDFSRALREQVPYATAVALTKTAAMAKDRVKEELPRHFIIRNQFTAKGIQHVRAEKKDWPNQKSVVGSISPYMAIQDEGGTKTPTGKAFAIPKGIRTDVKKLVARSKWPGKILQGELTIPMGGRSRGAKSGARNKPKAFLIKERDGVGVYVRIGKTRKLKRLYRLTRQTLHVKGQHWLEKPVNDVARAYLHKNFIEALESAMKSRR